MSIAEPATRTMHISLTANTDWYLWNFRLDLARAAVAAGHRVSLVCPDGPYVPRLREADFEVHTFRAPTAGFSIGQNRRALADITTAYGDLQPDLVHLFTPVCVLLGGMAASRVGVPHRVAALTGLGHVFTANTVKARAVRPGLRSLFRRELTRQGTAVIFQNETDRDELVAARVVREQHCHLIRGSGVDTNRFQPRSAPRNDDEVRILFASRLLHEKGLNELLAAFERVRESATAATLWIAGERYPANPSSLTEQEVENLANRPGVKLLGHVDDMPGLLSQVDIVALPSWREGTPKILLEAAACGLPILATDIPGCRGVVEDGVSGFLVSVGAVDELADRLGRLTRDEALRLRFGERGRAISTDAFSMARVVEETMAVYGSVANS